MRTGQPNTRTSCGARAPLSHADRLDPNAVFPDTRSRSLNTSSVSKNVPDRNPCGLRLHANTRLVGVGAFSGKFVAGGWLRQNGVASSRPPAGNAHRWAAGITTKL